MSDVTTGSDAGAARPKKKSKALLLGLLGALLLGGGTFYGIYSGMLPLPFGGGPMGSAGDGRSDAAEGDGFHAAAPGQTAFIPMQEMVISLGPEAASRHLKLKVSIEVDPDSEDAVAAVMPRIADVLNTFLRAVDEREFEIPRAMLRLRAQMVRRVQLVTPPGAVRDVLIQEFVLN